MVAVLLVLLILLLMALLLPFPLALPFLLLAVMLFVVFTTRSADAGETDESSGRRSRCFHERSARPLTSSWVFLSCHGMLPSGATGPRTG